jgi:flagellar biogenesis protein FliO
MDAALGAASLLSAAGSLLVILAVLAGAAYLARRLRNARGWRGGAAPLIDIIATRSIGPQASLMIIEAQGQRFLIGAGRGGITSIGALTAPGHDFSALLRQSEQQHETGAAP